MPCIMVGMDQHTVVFSSTVGRPKCQTSWSARLCPAGVTRRLSQVSTVRPEHDDKLLPDVMWVCQTVASSAEWR